MASLYRRSGRLCGVYRALPLNAIAKLLASRANIVSQHWKFWSIGMIAGARRIAIVATLAFIRRDDLHDAFAVTALLLAEEHDLIHKAAGWMLRETGKRSMPALLGFLEQHYSAMPRTALRYAIERLRETRCKLALKGLFNKLSG